MSAVPVQHPQQHGQQAGPRGRTSKPFTLRFPQHEEGHDQDTEWCELYTRGGWRRLRMHDYHEIYAVPGLYEYLFYDVLQCTSPERVVGLLDDVMRDQGVSPTTLSMLDIGAGNGMVGAALRTLGIRNLVGLDIIPEAKTSAERDRPTLYDDYVVADLCDLDEKLEHRLREHKFNGLTTVSALGFGDIPPKAFATAFNLVDHEGWLAFNIKEDFLTGADGTGFCRLIRAMGDQQVIRIEAYRRYVHRLSIYGTPLTYVAVTARKLTDVTDEMVEQASAGE